ncbi:MAG: FHA domain-containing protein [Sandaracinaceae bacterium]|nr:FHA domain-containing protein [Sandaracinaceae bacterium]
MSSEDAMKALSAAGLAQAPSMPGSMAGEHGGQPARPRGGQRDHGGPRSSNTIVLENPVVSARHAKISRNAQGGLLVQDLGSTNGTYLRGERIQQRVVTLQDDIYLGSAPLRMADPRVASLIIAVQRPPPEGAALHHRQRRERLRRGGARSPGRAAALPAHRDAGTASSRCRTSAARTAPPSTTPASASRRRTRSPRAR